MPNSAIKKIAREALKNKFIHSMIVCSVLLFLFFTIILTATLVADFSGNVGYFATLILLLVFVFCPLMLGVFNFFRRLLWEQNDNTLVIFKYFSNAKQYMRAIKFAVLQGGRYLVAAVVLYLPSAVVWMFSNEKVYSSLDLNLPIWSANLGTLNWMLIFIATMLFVFITLKYYLSMFIFISNDDIDIAEAINMSNIISKRTGSDFFGLVLSFAVWIIISVLIFPLIFVLPYFITAYCVHCRSAIAAYNNDVDSFNSASTPSFSVDEI